MKNFLVGLVAALAAAQATNARALERYVLTGPTTNAAGVGYGTPGLLGGEYLLQYRGDAPLENLFIEDTYQFSFNDFDYSGNNVGGDDEPIYSDYSVSPDLTSFTTTTFFPYIPAGGTIVYSTDPQCFICTEVDTYGPLSTTYDFYFASDPSTGDPISGNFAFTISSVPEPEAWLLLTLGLSGLGCALRRSRLSRYGRSVG